MLSSCNKEDPQNPVMAGEHDTNFVFHQFPTPLSIDLQYDSLINYYSGIDSIDVNLDGSYDLIISQLLQIPHLTDFPTNKVFPHCNLTPKNGLELALNIRSYGAGFGYFETIKWVESIISQDRIDKISDWSTSVESQYMWSNALNSSGSDNGRWYQVLNPEMYIGLRMKIHSDYKYGWIKVDATSRENIQFLSYAIEK